MGTGIPAAPVPIEEEALRRYRAMPRISIGDLVTVRWELNGDVAFSVNGIDLGPVLTGLPEHIDVAMPTFKLYVPNSLGFEGPLRYL